MKSKIRIGVPKGGVHSRSLDLANSISNAHIQKERLSVSTDIYDIFFLKHRDIARMLKEGLLDFGITSEEWLEEINYHPQILLRLDWCHTQISLICHPLSENINTCVTEFPNIASEYFAKERLDVDVYKVNGSSEALVPLLFDSCIDCVESGNTLVKNNLITRTVIMESDIVLVGKMENSVEMLNYIVSDFYPHLT